MKLPIKSFLIATFSVLFCLATAWMYLKSKANTQLPPRPVRTTFFESSEKFMVVRVATEMSPDEIKKLSPETVVWVDTQVSKDGEVIVLAQHELTNPNYNPTSSDRTPDVQLAKLPVRYMNWTDVEKIQPTAKRLEQLFDDQHARRWVINVVDYSPGFDQIFSDFISKKNAGERIILQSEQDGPLSDLRKLQPMWLYGTSRAQIVQTLWLTTLGLEALAPLKGDVLITQLHASRINQNAVLATPDLIVEAKRRSMKVLIGPALRDEFEEIRKLGVDGVITPESQQF